MHNNDEVGKPVLAIVVPCYNEEEVLPLTIETLNSLIGKMIDEGLISPGSFACYVDDGSRDLTWQIIADASGSNPAVKGIKLAGNTGHQNALMAGLDVCADNCDAIVTIDADLQDDTEAVPEMVRAYLGGADIVYGVRSDRTTDTAFKRGSALFFYRFMQKLGVKTVYNHADFRLMSRRAVKALQGYRERNLFLRGIVPLIGYPQAEVYYSRRRREAGVTKYPLSKMLNFAIDGITSFSIRPVRLVFALGIIFLAVAFCLFVYVMVRYFSNETIEGWTSLILSIWFCTGVLLVALGVIGEYIGKIYTEVKSRPRYEIDKVTD